MRQACPWPVEGSKELGPSTAALPLVELPLRVTSVACHPEPLDKLGINSTSSFAPSEVEGHELVERNFSQIGVNIHELETLDPMNSSELGHACC
jgi:hypothetical protein